MHLSVFGLMFHIHPHGGSYFPMHKIRKLQYQALSHVELDVYANSLLIISNLNYFIIFKHINLY